MKKILFIICLILGASNLQAQEVYNAVVEQAQKVVLSSSNPESPTVRIAQFKYSAMRYLYNKMMQEKGEADIATLDYQAYNMSVFITAMFGELKKEAFDNGKKRVLQKYIKAAHKHPMFNDPDKETTQCFMTDNSSLTPFSLDTDWQKAAEELGLE